MAKAATRKKAASRKKGKKPVSVVSRRWSCFQDDFSDGWIVCGGYPMRSGRLVISYEPVAEHIADKKTALHICDVHNASLPARESDERDI